MLPFPAVWPPACGDVSFELYSVIAAIRHCRAEPALRPRRQWCHTTSAEHQGFRAEPTAWWQEPPISQQLVLERRPVCATLAASTTFWSPSPRNNEARQWRAAQSGKPENLDLWQDRASP